VSPNRKGKAEISRQEKKMDYSVFHRAFTPKKIRFKNDQTLRSAVRKKWGRKAEVSLREACAGRRK